MFIAWVAALMSRLRAASPWPHRTSIPAGIHLQHNNCITPKLFCLHSNPRSCNVHSRRSRIATFTSTGVWPIGSGCGGGRLLGCSWWLPSLLKDGRKQSEYRLSSRLLHMVWQGDKTNWAWHRNPTSISRWLSAFFLTRLPSPRYGGPAPRGDFPNRRPIHFLQ